MKKFEGVMIACDLDGTLLTSTHRDISDENLEKIKYFTDNGGVFTVATGRPPISAKPILDMLNLDAPAVLLNGAIIYDYKKDEIISKHSLDEKMINISKEIITKYPLVGCEVFTEDDLLMVNKSDASVKHLENVNKPPKLTSYEELPSVDNWFKINYASDDHEMLLDIQKHFVDNYGTTYESCFSCKRFFETNNMNARKDKGMFAVADILGISHDHVYAIGDNFNDYFMVKNAKLGFAPANAETEVKEAAYKVLSGCDDHCVAEMISILDEIYS